MSFRIRPASPADLAAVAAGSPARPWTLEELSGPDGFRGVLAEHRNRVVGFWGARVQPMSVRGDVLLFGVLAGCFLEAPYRTGGVHSAFIEMDETFASLFEGREPDRFASVVGRPAESDWWLLRRMRGFTPIRTETELVLPDVRTAVVASSEERAVIYGAAECARWTRPLLVGEAAPIRDGVRMLARRGDDGVLHCVERDGVPVAAAVARTSADGAVDVVDWCVAEHDESSASALLAAVLADRKGEARFPVFGRSPWTSWLQRAGFRSRPSTAGGPSEPYLAARSVHPRCDAEWLAEHWFATAADVCRYPMEPCQIEEDAVFPPPPGTRAGSERHG